MPSEKSFQDHLQHAGDLYEAVLLFAPIYQPADQKYSFAALETAIGTANAASILVVDKRLLYQDVVTDRVTLVKEIGPLVTQALSYVKSNTAWNNRLEAIKQAADKVRGIRPPREKPKDPETDKKARDRGDRSYVEIAELFRAFVARLKPLPGYSPTDARISLLGLTEKWTILDGLNKSRQSTSQALADAITDRHESFTGEKGLKFVFDGVKTSTKGQYGQSSKQFKAISGIRW